MIEWSEVLKPDSECMYTHVIGESPFGRFLLTWKSWKEYDTPTLDESPWGPTGYAGHNIEAAKANVEAEFKRPAAREIERLRGLLREARDVIQTAYEEAGGFWYKAEKLLPRIDAALDTNSAANRVTNPMDPSQR